ncbi:NAD(P)H-hydrate dehydratase [Weissella koreensis]|uniref:ADP-dependent (S)-NAD(P)H-hydrate dehydratase n=1 Tax=Weissella koreensis TaxID=165096 RepID=A0A7H1ML49_9LACO|nr:NAD(P)H-hydrate dehydratase [Weissella koreensis]AVH74981.1 NAD(P)H-hydrate dehydratase [Weissella koreensis]EJF33390.1 carbohydrate kinase [Weissella koreensis KCTC 3621]QGN20207.1 NAD(P)H-hydrate dehydratase [Weissella koreensis]QNT64185.1 NAD(P)H-hydrate dehydratase [Weissella koreensis]
MVTELKADILHEVIQKRPTATNKTNFGKLLLIGGNQQYGGAILMAASAAVNSGAGLVTVATHADNITALHVRNPEAMALDWSDQGAVLDHVRKSSVVLIGPGLGNSDAAVELLRSTMRAMRENQTLILDASALGIIADKHIMIPNNVFTIATPHQGEWAKLSSVMVAYQDSMELNDLQRKTLNIDVLVLKKYHTVILSENRQMQLLIGGPYQATGGMGDTLAGLIAGFVGQFAEPRRATEAAVYAHSAIAQELAEHNWVVRPSFISDFVPNYMARINTNLPDII